LIRVDGSHTARDALEVVTDESGAPVPDWFHAAGGVKPIGDGCPALVGDDLECVARRMRPVDPDQLSLVDRLAGVRERELDEAALDRLRRGRLEALSLNPPFVSVAAARGAELARCGQLRPSCRRRGRWLAVRRRDAPRRG